MSIFDVLFDVKINLGGGLRVVRNHCVAHPIGIKIIQNKNTIGLQTFGNALQRRDIVRFFIEIAKTGEDVENEIEVIDSKRFTHIVLKKTQIIRLKLSRKMDAVFG